MIDPVLSALEAEARLAVEAARAAGQALARLMGQAQGVRDDSGRDIKLEADLAAESAALAVLRDKSPWPILTEERGELAGQAEDSGWRWVLDPLDGTLNFSRGIPLCCVSLALFREGEPRLGVIHDFNRDELFLGVAGQGAWLNGVPIRIGAVTSPAKGVLCTGFPVATDFSAPAVTEFVQGVRAWKKVRLLGSAALSLAWVACGRTDAYFERNIKLWDVGAGLALVLAAGGRVLRRPTDRPNVLDVFASNHDLPAPEIF